MKKIRVNQEFIDDLIAQKICKDREAFFDTMENFINEGYEVCFYSSYIIAEENPKICFNDINKFKEWRKGQFDRFNELKNILKNRKFVV